MSAVEKIYSKLRRAYMAQEMQNGALKEVMSEPQHVLKLLAKAPSAA